MTPIEFSALGMIGSAHFGLMTFVPLSENGAELSNGAEDIQRFAPPSNFSWNPWMARMQSLGCRSAMYTTKHHDGFCTWPSASTPTRALPATAWSIANGRTNLAVEFAQSAVSYGMGVGFYFAAGDAYLGLLFGSYNASYKTRILAQLTELLEPTQYPCPIDYILIDGYGDFWAPGFPSFSQIPYAELAAAIHAQQPNILIIVNNHDTTTADVTLFEGPPDNEPAPGSTRPVAYWSPVRTSNQWFTHSDTSPEKLQPALLRTQHRRNRMLRRGYCYMINESPGPTGLIPADMDLILTSSRQPLAALADGLESFWKFDEAAGATIEDYVNTNSLSLVGTVGTTTGKIGGARTFSGGSYAERTGSYNRSLGVGDYSYAFAGWAQVTSITSFNMLLAKNHALGAAIEYELFIDTENSNRLHWRITRDGTNQYDVLSSTITTGTPFFFAARFNSTTREISLRVNASAFTYRTGVAAFSSPYYTASPFTLACRGAGLLPTTCWLDELAFYKRWITDADVDQLYNLGGANTPPFAVEAPRGSLFATPYLG